MKVRTERIDNNEIYVIDHTVEPEDIEKFYALVKSLSYSRNEKDDEKDKFPIFSVDFVPEKVEGSTVIGKMARQLLSEFYPDQDFFLSRSYINMSHYGDMEYPHRDCPEQANDITILYYVNNHWDYTWGGETVFYEEKDPKILVLPAPGRFVIFPGRVEHLGSIPTRDCNQSRFSFALKYKPGQFSI